MTARDHAKEAVRLLTAAEGCSAKDPDIANVMQAIQARALTAIALALTEGEPEAPKVGMVYTDKYGNRREITSFSCRPVQ